MTILVFVGVIACSLFLIGLIVSHQGSSVWTPIPKDEFLGAVNVACAPLVALGFTPVAAEQQYATFQRDVVTVSIWQDKAGELVLFLSRKDVEADVHLSTLSRYLGNPNPQILAEVYCSDQASATAYLTRCVTFLLEFAPDWLQGDLQTYQGFQDYFYVENGLYTQPSTAERRPNELWEPIESAWRSGQLQFAYEHLQQLPKPLTGYEQQAIDYLERHPNRTSSTHFRRIEEPDD